MWGSNTPSPNTGQISAQLSRILKAMSTRTNNSVSYNLLNEHNLITQILKVKSEKSLEK